MKFLSNALVQAGRNMRMVWGSQLMTFITVSLSVLIFAFFYLIYLNMVQAAGNLGEHLRLIVYLDEEPNAEMRVQYRYKITTYEDVEDIKFITKKQAYKRFKAQLGKNSDILTDMPEDFLPPSIEVYPIRSLKTLARAGEFSDYLQTLPGVVKVQYGQGWLKRFYLFIKLLRIVVILSGSLLVLTSIFMVSSTIKLTILRRQAELELLRLVGATNAYIRTPFLLEGFFQGLFGAGCGLCALYFFYLWIKQHFSGPEMLGLFNFTFFSLQFTGGIILAGILLCALGGFFSIHKYLRL